MLLKCVHQRTIDFSVLAFSFYIFFFFSIHVFFHFFSFKQDSELITHTHTHTHTHFRVDVGKSRKHAEKNGWPEGRQACDGMKTKNKLRQARRTRSPLQHAARTGAARTGASCREAGLGPTQRRLGRPAVEHENGRPTGK